MHKSQTFNLRRIDRSGDWFVSGTAAQPKGGKNERDPPSPQAKV